MDNHVIEFTLNTNGSFRAKDKHADSVFTRKQLKAWLHHALDNQVAMRRDDGVPVTAVTVKITVELQADEG